jgi:NhaA family Na+:H+ antiporter
MTEPWTRKVLRRAIDLSLALPFGAGIALVWANVAHGSYERFANALHFVVNDVGMVFFFGLATKEVVEATAPGGALHTWKRAALPVVAAVGGMVGPALIYVAFIHALELPELARGWAIPCATDIAFSYLVARAIFRQHAAIPFLLLLAIADDALGLVILALFYPTGDVHLGIALGLMAVSCAASMTIRRRNIAGFWPYVVVGGGLSWAALFWGGLHPALALVPVVPFMPHAHRDPELFVEALPDAHDTLGQFERWWKVPVQGVLLLFGFVNAGVPIAGIGAGTWAVLLAILLGKPLGIGLSVLAARCAGLQLPGALGWREVVVVGLTAAIGFTVALFFATAAFPAGPLLDRTKMGALLSVGSSVVAIAAAATLRVGRFRASEAGGRGR